MLKPNAILFQEQLPYDVWRKTEQAVDSCDVLIVVGSSLEVLPVAALPVRAVNHGANLIVLNNMPTYVDERATVVINADVGDTLTAIEQGILD